MTGASCLRRRGRAKSSQRPSPQPGYGRALVFNLCIACRMRHKSYLHLHLKARILKLGVEIDPLAAESFPMVSEASVPRFSSLRPSAGIQDE